MVQDDNVVILLLQVYNIHVCHWSTCICSKNKQLYNNV